MMAANLQKLKAAVHYVCRLYSARPEKLGKVKLHKILWYTDGQTFLRFGKAAIGEDYSRAPYGPMSEHLDAVIAELEGVGRMHVRKIPFHGYDKFEFVCQGDADMSAFDERELKVLDRTAREIAENETATSISEKTHDALWDMARNGERLPYQLFLVPRMAPVTDAEIAWARAEIKRIEQNA